MRAVCYSLREVDQWCAAVQAALLCVPEPVRPALLESVYEQLGWLRRSTSASACCIHGCVTSHRTSIRMCTGAAIRSVGVIGAMRRYRLGVRIYDTFALHIAQKDRTDPSVGRSRVRERGTSGHAAAH